MTGWGQRESRQGGPEPHDEYNMDIYTVQVKPAVVASTSHPRESTRGWLLGESRRATFGGEGLERPRFEASKWCSPPVVGADRGPDRGLRPAKERASCLGRRRRLPGAYDVGVRMIGKTPEPVCRAFLSEYAPGANGQRHGDSVQVSAPCYSPFRRSRGSSNRGEHHRPNPTKPPDLGQRERMAHLVRVSDWSKSQPRLGFLAASSGGWSRRAVLRRESLSSSYD